MTKPIARDPIYRRRVFDAEIIQLCVRWYITYRLSYRDLAELMAERGVPVAHSTILRWVTRYVPEFEKRWNRFSRPVGTSWRVDETCIAIRGKWHYLCRAVDKPPDRLKSFRAGAKNIRIEGSVRDRTGTLEGIIMGIVTVACPITGEQVPTGIIVDARTFETTDFEGRKFQCDACAEVHSWNKADAMVQPDNVRPAGRVPGLTGIGRTGRGVLSER